MLLMQLHCSQYIKCNRYTSVSTFDSTGVTSLATEGDATTVGGTLDVTGLSTLASGDVNGGNIDNTVMSATTKAAGSFTSVKVDGDEGILINKDAPNATESDGRYCHCHCRGG